jgi:glucokinase
MSAIVGIDVGATTLAGGLVTREGDILHAIQRPTHRGGPGTAMESVLALVHELLGEARSRRLTLAGIGVGVAGVVDTEKGVMLPHPCNALPELAHVPLAESIRSVTDLPAFVDNDANALALAEWTFGVGRGAHSLVLFAIGTNIGGGIVLGDALFRGANGYAGELHAVPINFDGPRCYCGARGCLGAYIGGHVIAAEARQRLADGAPSSLLGLAGGDPAAVTAELVFHASVSGDPVAREIVSRACDALGAGIAFVVNCLNPEVVVVTGGVARSLAPLADELRSRVAVYAMGGAAMANARIHIVEGDKRQTVRGGAALVLYELARGAKG